MIAFRGGKLPPDPSKPRLRLAPFLAPAVVEVPPTCDWLTAGGTYPMDGNADWGDCVWADYAHEIQSTTAAARGTAAILDEGTVLAAYSAATGFDPHAGPPGDNPTDQGTNMQDALSWWRKHGYGGHSIAVFAQVDHGHLGEVMAAIDLFGAVSVGFNFPDSAMDQFNAGQPWTVVKGARIEGGHAVHAGAYVQADGVIEVVTWGKRQRMTFDFWQAYVDEAWVKVPSVDWFSQAGRSPSGLDLHGLGEQFSILTGERNPFPPSPEPVPVPPAPETVTPADRVLDAALRDWARGHHVADNHRAAAAVLTWERAKGLSTGGS